MFNLVNTLKVNFNGERDPHKKSTFNSNNSSSRNNSTNRRKSAAGKLGFFSNGSLEKDMQAPFSNATFFNHTNKRISDHYSIEQTIGQGNFKFFS